MFTRGSHFLKLLFILPVVVEIVVHLFLWEHTLLIKEPLCKGMILLLNSFSFPLPEAHVERTDISSHLWWLLWPVSLHWGPLSSWYLNQLVQQYLVFTVDWQVALIDLKVLVLLFFFLFLTELHIDYLSLLFGYLRVLNVVQFFQVLLLTPIKTQEQELV